MAKLKQIIKEEMELASEGHGGFAGAARQKKRSQMHSDRMFRGTQALSGLMRDFRATPPDGIDRFSVDEVVNMFQQLLKYGQPLDRPPVREGSDEMKVIEAWMDNDIGRIVAAAYTDKAEYERVKSDLEELSRDYNMAMGKQSAEAGNLVGRQSGLQTDEAWAARVQGYESVKK